MKAIPGLIVVDDAHHIRLTDAAGYESRWFGVQAVGARSLFFPDPPPASPTGTSSGVRLHPAVTGSTQKQPRPGPVGAVVTVDIEMTAHADDLGAWRVDWVVLSGGRFGPTLTYVAEPSRDDRPPLHDRPPPHGRPDHDGPRHVEELRRDLPVLRARALSTAPPAALSTAAPGLLAVVAHVVPRDPAELPGVVGGVVEEPATVWLPLVERMVELLCGAKESLPVRARAEHLADAALEVIRSALPARDVIFHLPGGNTTACDTTARDTTARDTTARDTAARDAPTRPTS